MSETSPQAPWIGVQRNRLLQQRGHAWLLQGPSGLGQYELGLSLVRAWLCEQPTAEGPAGIAAAAMRSMCVPMPISACSCPRCR